MMSELSAVFGRLHPLVLHLPIGLLIALGAMELARMARPQWRMREAVAVLAWLTGAAGVLAAGTGFVLGLEPGYEGDTVNLHRWLGIGVGVMCLVVAVVHSRLGAQRVWVYRGALVVTIVLVVPAGHFGG